MRRLLWFPSKMKLENFSVCGCTGSVSSSESVVMKMHCVVMQSSVIYIRLRSVLDKQGVDSINCADGSCPDRLFAALLCGAHFYCSHAFDVTFVR